MVSAPPELIRALQLEDSRTGVFETEIKNFVKFISLKPSEKYLTLSSEEFKKTELNYPETGKLEFVFPKRNYIRSLRTNG